MYNWTILNRLIGIMIEIRTWLHNLPGTGFDEKLPCVQVCQDELEPTEGFC